MTTHPTSGSPGSSGSRGDEERAPPTYTGPTRLLLAAFRQAPLAMTISSLADGRLLDVNDAFVRLTGFTRDEAIGQTTIELGLVTEDDRGVVVSAVSAGGRVDRLPIEIGLSDGTRVPAIYSGELVEVEGAACLLSVVGGDAELREIEIERSITLDLLRLLNQSDNLRTLLRDITVLMQSWSGCEAVGIRLRQGQAFPFVEVRGLDRHHAPEACVTADSGMAEEARPRRPGAVVGDATGFCVCRAVIEGPHEPRDPWFTEAGSFWTNHVSALPFAARQGASGATDLTNTSPRGACLVDDCESLAIVPMRQRGQVVGLLHFGDTRRNRFRRSTISLLERLAINVAIGLEHRAAADAWRRNELLMARTEERAHIGSWQWDLEADRATWSAELYRIFGRDPALGVPSFADHETLFEHGAWRAIAEQVKQVRRTAVPALLDVRPRRPDGFVSHCVAGVFPETDEAGRVVRLSGFVQDVTERREAELALERSRAELQAVYEHSPVLMCLLDHDRHVLYANRAFTEFTAITEHELRGGRAGEVIRCLNALDDPGGCGLGPHCETCALRLALLDTWTTGRSHRDVEYRTTVERDGVRRDIVLIASTARVPSSQSNALLLCLHDITERKLRETVQAARLRLLEFAAETRTTPELLQRFLDETEALTSSTIGFYHFVDADQETLSLQAWSTNTIATQCTAEGFEAHYPISQAGVWVDCVRVGEPVVHNDYDRLPHKRGLPEGHAPVLRQLVVPVKRAGRIVAILGVGNKPFDYDQHDVGLVSQLADLAWEMVERVRVEEALRASERQQRAMLEAWPDLLFRLDGELRIVDWTSSDPGLLFMPEEQFLGRSIDEVLPPDLAGRIRAAATQVGETGALQTLDYEATTLAGTRAFEARMVSCGEHDRLAVIRDVTDEKQALAALAHAQEVLALNHRVAQRFLTSEADAVFTDVADDVSGAIGARFGAFGFIDDAGALVCATRSSAIRVPEATTGPWIVAREEWERWADGALVAQTLAACEPGPPMGGADAGLDNAVVVPIVHDRALIGAIVVGNRPEGFGPRQVEMLDRVARQVAPVLRELRERERANTLRRRLEEQLLQAQKLEAIGQLTGGVAHDFNNLLLVINGYAELARLDLDDGHPAQAALTEIAQAGARAARLVEQLLLFSRRRIMRPELLDVNAAVDEMLRMLGRVIGETIVLDWSPGADLWPVRGDRGMIEQAVMNLCLNARDAMPEGGTVTMSSGTVTLDVAACATRPWALPGAWVRLSVRDTGVGMNAETRAHVFEPFFTTKPTGKGTGLGLATVYGIVKQHRGLVNVTSEPGCGTTFDLYFPRADEAAGLATNPPVVDEVAGGRETILLAEDDPHVRELGRAMLERAGYRVILATNGREAVQTFEREAASIDLMLLDVIMPEMGGREAFERIRALGATVPVLFASGYDSGAIHSNFVLDEGLRLLHKPFERVALLRAVRTLLDE